MIQRSLFCAGLSPFLIFPVLLLLLFILFQWRSIEQEVSVNAMQNLNKLSIDWAQIETFNRGRDVLITGNAPNADSIETAKQGALVAKGIRQVTFAGHIKQPPTPAKLLMRWVADEVIISGTLNNQTELDSIITQAQAVYGKSRVKNFATIGANTSALISIEGIFEIIGSFLNDGDKLTVTESNLTLSGTLEQLEANTDFIQQLTKIFPGTIQSQLIVDSHIAECQAKINHILQKSTINFDVGKTTLPENSVSLLDDIAKISEQCPNTKYIIIGHTDSTGDMAANKALSELRAQAIVSHLMDQGLDPKRVSVKSYGSNEPIATNETAAGRAQNRRIEIKIHR